TSDGGQSWHECYEYHQTGIPSQIEKRIWRLKTLSEKKAVALIDGKALLRTEDSGMTWQTVGTTIEDGFNSVSFSTNGTGWAVGTRVPLINLSTAEERGRSLLICHGNYRIRIGGQWTLRMPSEEW